MFRLSPPPPPPSLLSRPTQHILYVRHLPAVCSQVWRLPDSPGVTHSWYYWAMWPGNPFHLWSVSERQSTAGCRLYSSRLYRLYADCTGWYSERWAAVGQICKLGFAAVTMSHRVSLPRAPTSFWRKDLNIHEGRMQSPGQSLRQLTTWSLWEAEGEYFALRGVCSL